MGDQLKKKLFAYENWISPQALPDKKILANEWEQQFADENNVPEPRPLNIDPGYISEAKLVLATTKDRDHRVYLRDGIFAEVTLHFSGQKWLASRWTYPDYRAEKFHSFFTNCRNYLREKYRADRTI